MSDMLKAIKISHASDFASVRDGHDWVVEAHDKSGKKVGHVRIYKDSEEHKLRGTISSSDSWVEPSHRRKGIASAMYQHAEKHAGARMKTAAEVAARIGNDPEDYFSSDAEKLWSQPNRPFGKSEYGRKS